MAGASRTAPPARHLHERMVVPFCRLVTLGALGAAVLGAAPCAAQQPAPATASAGPASQPHPGDVVRLRVWREPDFSGEFPVDENGEAVFPRIGPMRVTGMSADSLKRSLVSTFAAYLRDPSIEVRLLRRVSVAGEVRTPGVFTVDPTVTVADVLALAGGTTPDGRKDRVEVLRNGRVVSHNVPRGTLVGDASVQSGDQLIVPQRSWMSRNAGLVAGLASSAVFLAASLLRN
jgi:polysaccharide export outer membrane protein